MLKIIDRYIVKEITIPFLMGLVIFTFVLLMNQILRLTELIVNRGVSILVVLKLFLYILPSFLVVTIPMALLLATLMAFGRLSADNEIVALKTNGISLYRMIIPVIGVSFITYLITGFIMTTALPWGNQSFKSLVFNIIRTKATMGIKERIFNDDFDGLVIYVNEVLSSNSNNLRGIVISDSRTSKKALVQEPRLIVAQEGTLIPDSQSLKVILRLKNGSIHVLGKDKNTYNKTDFPSLDLVLNMQEGLMKEKRTKIGFREMSIKELMAAIKEHKQKNIDYLSPLVELYKKFSIPFACLIFGILGTSLGVRTRRSEKATNFVISLGFILLYYIFLSAGEPLGKQGKISPLLSMWAPNIFFGIFTVYLFIKTANESSIKLLDWGANVFDRTINWIKERVKLK